MIDLTAEISKTAEIDVKLSNIMITETEMQTVLETSLASAKVK